MIVNDMDSNRLLGVVDVARMLGVGKISVMRMMDIYRATDGRDGLPWVIIPGAKCRKVRAGSLSDYLARQERASLS